jgi:hypothetical protein
MAPAGLVPNRSNLAHQLRNRSLLTRFGAKLLRLLPVPQFASALATNASTCAGEEMRVGTVQQQRAGALRIRGGEQDGHRPALGGTEQCRLIGARGVHHRSHIVHPRFQVRHVAYAIGQAGASLVEHDEAREGSKAVEEVRQSRVFPLDLKIGNETLHEDDVDRAVADDLVGDMDAAASGVFCLRTDQSTWPPTGAKAPMKLSVPVPPDSDRA